MGNWNILTLKGKELELVEEAKRYHFDIIGVSSNKRRKIEGVTLINKVRSSEIRISLNIERYFSELKDLSLDGLAMLAECLRKDSRNKLYLPKQMGEDQLDDLELDGPITLRILDGTAWDFAQAK